MVGPNVPAYLKGKKVVGCTPQEFGKDVDLVFSALVRSPVFACLLDAESRPHFRSLALSYT
jgi:hypothetical protein